jgi:hypothetical protein
MSKLVWLISIAALTTAVACGGSKKSADKPEDDNDGDLRTVEEEQKQDVLIPEEKYTEIHQFFLRKARIVSQCFPKAIEAGEVGKNAKGYVTVRLTITKDGKPSKVRIGKASLESKTLAACVIHYVERWNFPTLPKDLPYSHTFAFSSM